MTSQQRACLEAFRELTRDGVPPKYEAVAERIGLKSKSGVSRLVEALIDQGELERVGGRYGTIRIPAPTVASLTREAMLTMPSVQLAMIADAADSILAERVR